MVDAEFHLKGQIFQRATVMLSGEFLMKPQVVTNLKTRKSHFMPSA